MFVVRLEMHLQKASIKQKEPSTVFRPSLLWIAVVWLITMLSISRRGGGLKLGWSRLGMERRGGWRKGKSGIEQARQGWFVVVAAGMLRFCVADCRIYGNCSRWTTGCSFPYVLCASRNKKCVELCVSVFCFELKSLWFTFRKMGPTRKEWRTNKVRGDLRRKSLRWRWSVSWRNNGKN